MNSFFAKLFATYFYLGYFPFAAGSLASIVGALLALALRHHLGWYLLVFTVITVLGFIASAKMEQITGEKDPACIVIDEVSGAMIAFFLLPATPAIFITTFFVFRAFDMFKIYPADILETKPSGVGVMMDDIVAGLYTTILMHAAVWSVVWMTLAQKMI